MVERHHLPRPVFFIIYGNCTMQTLKPIDKYGGLVYTDSQSNSLPGGYQAPVPQILSATQGLFCLSNGGYKMELTKVVAVRLPAETARRIEQMAAAGKVNQSTILRAAISRGMELEQVKPNETV